jgi:hypothetical protein
MSGSDAIQELMMMTTTMTMRRKVDEEFWTLKEAKLH